MNQSNEQSAFNAAYRAQPVVSAPHTYQVAFSFLLFPDGDPAREQASMVTGMQGALAKAARERGYISMQVEGCEGVRAGAGKSIVSGKCLARMYRVPKGQDQDAMLIEDVIAQAEAHRSQFVN